VVSFITKGCPTLGNVEFFWRGEYWITTSGVTRGRGTANFHFFIRRHALNNLVLATLQTRITALHCWSDNVKVFLIGHYYLQVGCNNAHAIYYPILNGVISTVMNTYSLTEYNIQTLSHGTYLLYSLYVNTQ